MSWKHAGLVTALAALALAPSAHAAPLRAGVASADITPENGGTTFGFVRPDIAVKGVHTRLMGRVLDVNRNRSIEAHLANHDFDLFYGQGDATDDPMGEDHARDTRLRLLRV